MNKRHGASAVSPRFYFTTLLVLVIIIFLCTPGGRKSFRQAGLTNGNALVHGYWFAPIGWPVDYDIDTSNVEFIDDSKFKPKAEAEMILEIGLVETNSCARHFHHDHLQPLQLLQPLQPLQRLIQDSDVPYLHYSGLY